VPGFILQWGGNAANRLQGRAISNEAALWCPLRFKFRSWNIFWSRSLTENNQNATWHELTKTRYPRETSLATLRGSQTTTFTMWSAHGSSCPFVSLENVRIHEVKKRYLFAIPARNGWVAVALGEYFDVGQIHVALAVVVVLLASFRFLRGKTSLQFMTSCAQQRDGWARHALILARFSNAFLLARAEAIARVLLNGTTPHWSHDKQYMKHNEIPPKSRLSAKKKHCRNLGYDSSVVHFPHFNHYVEGSIHKHCDVCTGTARPDGSRRWDNRMAAQHLPRELVQPSSVYEEMAQNIRDRKAWALPPCLF